MWDEIKCQGHIENSDCEESNVQTLSEKPRIIGHMDSEEVDTPLLGLASGVPEIKPKVDALIADCEASGLELASRSGYKICWACGLWLDGRDPYEESQNLCSFC